MFGSTNRPGHQSNIIHPFNVQRQKHIQNRSLIKILHGTSACLSSTIIHSGNKDVNEWPLYEIKVTFTLEQATQFPQGNRGVVPLIL